MKTFPHTAVNSARALARWENEGGAINSASDPKKETKLQSGIWRKQFARLVRAIGLSRPGRRRRAHIL